MLAVLPFLAWAFSFAAFRRTSSDETAREWRWSVLAASVLWGLLLAAGTEVVSAAGLLARGPLAVFWALALGAAAAVFFRGSARRARAKAVRNVPIAPLAVANGLLLATVGSIALASPPNSWDALTYHLPRALHWLQQGDVGHYPTHILRQLFMPPLSEYAEAHLAALSGGDRLANLPQWLALAGCAAGVSRIAKQLGATPSGSLAAAVFALSLPMSLAQGSSSQNDLVVAFWLIAAASFLLPLTLSGREPQSLELLLGAAGLGLALATKATAHIYAAPFLLLFGLAFLRRRPRRWLRLAFLCAALVLAPSVPHWARNQRVFGSPLGPPAGVVVETFSAPGAVSGLLRNAAIHLALPAASWNRGIEAGVERLLAAVGADASDPRTTWPGSRFHVPPVPPGSDAADADETVFLLLHEGYATSPLHLLLAVAALAASRRAGRPAVAYALACAGAFLLFAIALKWQPWHARLHLPVFLLAAPLVGLSLSSRPKVSEWVCALLLLAALPWLLLNSTRPLLGQASVLRTSRLEGYFVPRPDLLESFTDAARTIPPRSCPVGLRIGPDDPEYLVRVALQAAGHPPRALEHVDVRNASSALTRPRPTAPCALWELPLARPVGAASRSLKEWPRAQPRY